MVLKCGQMPHYLQVTEVLPILVYPSLHCWLPATPTDLLPEPFPRLPQSGPWNAQLVDPREHQLVVEKGEIPGKRDCEE